MNDPLHRTSRDLCDAAHQCDAWNMILDTTTVLNYDHGLYLACANFNKCIEAADMYCSMVSPDDDLLHVLLPIILEDMLADMCPNFCSFDDIKRFLSEMKFDSCFEKMTEHVKWTRWGSHQNGMVKCLLVRGKKLLVCVL